MEPIVLIPGLLCTETLYAPQIVALADRPVLVADHRRHDSIAAIAADILAVAPERFALAGLSMGGYIALEILRAAPERVSRLALLDTSPKPDAPEQGERRRVLIELAETGKFGKVPHLLYPGLVDASRVDDETLKATVVEMAQETGAEAFVRQQRAIMGRIDSRPSLAAIAVPTLVLVGDGDTLTPPQVAREMHAAISGSRLAVIPGCGHLSTLEAPGAVTAELQAWAKA
ncbi:alpha/beta fold hydrolase [Microvirga tunisiensis]|uniref:Alpha/beta fold hydrolase n=2 Tax=Pannonibacter tanglangensis TaxID=2750084 RepID=A0ABW9ZMT0_9HYPH|nr:MULTISPECIES: alpha/beta fold hydrolase [unclassified Pannonibacter]NBN66033.1 alpha/beta fold hydrolase [Pannonibacter sp. XCT-34]NBN80528.1 alpha/beta fold hydrolase [Pannonibacter sp. XCT-53]